MKRERGTVVSEPVNVWEFERKFLFGAIRFWHLIEDRRPDIAEGSSTAIKLGYKYKHQIKVRIGFFTYSIIGRSQAPQSIFVNDQEVKYP